MTRSKVMALTFLFFVAGSVLAFSQEQQHTQRMFNEIAYEILIPSFIRDQHQIEKSAIAGTFWAIEINGEVCLITAAHNMAWGPNSIPSKVGNLDISGGTKLLSISSHPVLGPLGYDVEQVGFLELVGDVVLIKPKEKAVFNAAAKLHLASEIPKLGERVTVYGYPSTAHEKAKDTTVASVNQASQFIVLNDALDAGYSGGVVLNDKHEAIGIVITTEAKQANAILLSPKLFSKVNWKPLAEIKTRKIAEK